LVIGDLSLAFLKTRYQGDSEQGVSLDVDVTRMLLECYGNTNRQPPHLIGPETAKIMGCADQ
jgi:hypothetical protein